MPFECTVSKEVIELGQSVVITGTATGGDTGIECTRVGYSGDGSDEENGPSYTFTPDAEGVYRPYAHFVWGGGSETAHGTRFVVNNPDN